MIRDKRNVHSEIIHNLLQFPSQFLNVLKPGFSQTYFLFNVIFSHAEMLQSVRQLNKEEARRGLVLGEPP